MRSSFYSKWMAYATLVCGVLLITAMPISVRAAVTSFNDIPLSGLAIDAPLHAEFSESVATQNPINLQFEISSSTYMDEISWYILDGSGTMVASGGPYPQVPSSGGMFVVDFSAANCPLLLMIETNGIYNDNSVSFVIRTPDNVITYSSGTVLGGVVYQDFVDCTLWGCTDATSCNYNPNANQDDGSCFMPSCTDPNACNYSWFAMCSGGTCIYPEYGYNCAGECVQPWVCDPCAFDPCICNPNLCIIWGCTDVLACNFNSSATGDDNSCYYPVVDYLDCSDNCVNDVDQDGICDELEVPGCTDPLACNYYQWATDDDGTCVFPAAEFLDCYGNCLNDDDQDGICNELEVLGCTDLLACNYAPWATDDDGTCVFAASQYVDCSGNCVNDDDQDGICDELEISGCTDPTACNYNALATDEDESCFIASCADSHMVCAMEVEMACVNLEAGILIEDLYFMGCEAPGDFKIVWNGNDNLGYLVPSMGAFAAYAQFDFCSVTIQDAIGASFVEDYGLADLYPFIGGNEFFVQTAEGNIFAIGNIQPVVNTGYSLTIGYEYRLLVQLVNGCTDPLAINFNPQAQIDNGTCHFVGCTDPNADNYDPIATLDDASCTVNGIAIVYGCTDPQAINYEAEANVDDNSCLIGGCTLMLACNYNPLADVNNGSCEFPAPGYDCYGYCMNPVECCQDQQVSFGPVPSAVAVGETIQFANPALTYYLLQPGYDYVVVEIGPNYYSVEATDESGFLLGYGACCATSYQEAVSFYPNATFAPLIISPISAFTFDETGVYLFAAQNDNGCWSDLISVMSELAGCTYNSATNYNASAVADDGSCIFEINNSECAADLNNDGVINAGDLLFFLSQFGTACD